MAGLALPEQLGRAQRPGPWDGPEAEDERLRWHYVPTDHGGLPLGRQRPAQQSLAMQSVATGFSAAGYVTVCGVMGLENVLDRTDGFPPGGDRERLRDPGLYYLRVFGAGRTGSVGMALRRPPRLPQQPRGRHSGPGR